MKLLLLSLVSIQDAISILKSAISSELWAESILLVPACTDHDYISTNAPRHEYHTLVPSHLFKRSSTPDHRRVFNSLPKRDSDTWATQLISGKSIWVNVRSEFHISPYFIWASVINLWNSLWWIAPTTLLPRF